MKKILGTYSVSSYCTNTIFSHDELILAAPDPKTYKYDEKYYHIASTMWHEYYHHLQLIGTSFGNYYSHLVSLNGCAISELTKACFQQGIPYHIIRPIFLNENFLKVNKEILFSVLRICNELNVLNGTSNENEFDQYYLINRDNFIFDIDIVPKIKIQGKTYYLGAKQIIEGFAYASTLLDAAHINRLPRDYVDNDFINSHDFDPYRILFEFMTSQLKITDERTQLLLFQLLCDLALNMPTADKKKQKYSDYHPGHRFLKALAYLRTCIIPENFYLRVAKKDVSVIQFLKEIKSALNWDRDDDFITYETHEFYRNSVLRIRKEYPLALIFVNSYNNELSEYFPFSFERHYPGNLQKIHEDDSNFETAVLYEYNYVIATFYERTAIELFYGTEVTCPWHNIVYPGQEKCPSECIFPQYFEKIFGITLEQYKRIPVKFK